MTISYLPSLLAWGRGSWVADYSTPIYIYTLSCLACWPGGGGGGEWWITPPLSTPPPAPPGLHDRHLPGLWVWGGRGWSTPPHLIWKESLTLSSLCVTGQSQLGGEWDQA